MNCEICSHSMSEPVLELFALPTVTSDCRPWSKGRSVQVCSGCGVMKRTVNSEFNHDVYKDYTSYPEPEGRTKKILEYVKDRMPKPESILDIGCGKGDGLQILRAQSPLAKVYGYEPTIHTDRPTGKYDLITLFHVLEHVEDLREMLAYIKSSLTENGHVLIQVPYTVMWPFDLIIADHEWHFTRKALSELLWKNGFKVVHNDNNIIEKEITLLACAGDKKHPEEYSNEEISGDRIAGAIDWLVNFKRKLDNIHEDVVVYGTSVSAMWAGNILGDKVVAYIDDDKSRLYEFNGKSVYLPETEMPVIAPFPDWQLPEIKATHPELNIL